MNGNSELTLKLSKSRKKYGVLDSSKKRTKLTILSTEGAQDSEFRSFFGRIEDTIICFRDCLTFSLVLIDSAVLVFGPIFDHEVAFGVHGIAFKMMQVELIFKMVYNSFLQLIPFF